MARVTGHIRLVQRKDGPVWYAKWRGADGRQVQRKLGPAYTGRGRPPAGHLTERLAREQLAAILVDARRGTTELGRGGAAVDVTFADAAAEYLRFVREVRKRDETTVRDYAGVINGYLLAEFGDAPVAAITADDVDEYKEQLLAEGRLSNRTIVRHLMVLNGIFKRAKRRRWVTDNPASADNVERPQVTYTGEFVTLTYEEVELLAGAAADAQDAALYRTAAYTGLRQGELLALRWRDVDFLAGLVHVRRNYTDRTEKVPKGKKVGSVPMMSEVAAALARMKDRERYTDEDDLVFPNEAGEFACSWALRRRYYKALDRAGLRRVRFHDLRHAFGSTAIKKLPPHTVQAYMRHAHFGTTQRYLHHQPRPADARLLEEAFHESSILPISGHAGDTSPVDPKARTGIEPVYTALQAPRDDAPDGAERRQR